jgi:MFS transporter, DHA1 family, tetracycline resistance protein
LGTTDIISSQQEAPDTKKTAPSSKAIIFLLIVAFLNTLGVTIIVPGVPFMTLEHLSSPEDLAIVNAWMVSIYGICQLLASTGLGLLSDRFGRRLVLFVCLFGSAIGYLLFGLGGSLWFLFLGRIIDGLTGGNMSVIYAYLADITESRERGKYFGIAGSVSGVGFIVGPFIGGLLATISYSAPFIVAAAVVLLNLIWGLFFLPESLPKEHRVAAIHWRDLNPLKQWSNVFTLVNLRWLLAAAFLYSLPFAIMISNLTVLLKDSLGWDATQAGLISSVVGIVDIFVQGILVGRLLTIFGDVKVGMGSLFVFAISNILLGVIALIASPLLLIAGVILFAGSSGLVENALRGMTSRLATPHQQGLVGGAGQSMTSLATIIGPLLGGLLYVHLGHAIPYWSAALMVILAIGAVLLSLRVQQTQTV